MAQLFTTQPLSGATNGQAVHITATTSGAAQTVHTAPAASKGYDRIWIWANNCDGSARVLSIEWTTTGAAGQLDMLIPTQAVPGDPIIDGLLLRNAQTVKAFAALAAVINLVGYVERYT